METKQKSKKELKTATVDSLGEKVSRAKTIIFVDYRGLSASQIAELRQQTKASGGELVVTKNTLIQKALTKNQLSATLDQLSGPTATVFAYEDEIAPIRDLAQSAKTTELPKFKFGFFNSSLIDASALENLAQLPPKNVLYAKITSALSAPIYGIVYVLNANIRNLVIVLSQASKRASS